MPSQSSISSVPSHLLLRGVVYGAAAVLALVHVFVTFQGVSSPAGMEQAQLAREVARGHGWQTKVIRPYAWARLEASAREASPAAMPEIVQPPAQPLLWAPLFKVLERHQTFDPVKGGSIYLLDRVIACVGVIGCLLALGWIHGSAVRLFDEAVAALVVLCLMASEPLWQLSVSGSPVALLLPLVALSFRFMVSAHQRVEEKLSIFWQAAAVGGLAAAMLLTHWMAVWMVAGLVLSAWITLPGRRASAAVITGLPVLALAAWGWWLLRASGDPLGGAKTLFQAHLSTLEPDLLQRAFSTTSQPVQMDDLLRKVAVNWRNQMGQGLAYLGFIVPAMMFFPALLHRFRRPEAARSCLMVAIMFATTALGMGMLGLPDKTQDDNALYIILAPLMAVFGGAMLVILWGRFHAGGGSLLGRQAIVWIAVALSALPMAAELPAKIKTGLVLRSRVMPHWPPYAPDRVTVIRRLLEPQEMVFADAPWFVAWYADVPAAWIPAKRDDFDLMSARAEASGSPVAGVVVSPLSARLNHLHEAFDGPYREWPDLIFRGPMLALDREFLPHPDFKFKLPVPLVGLPVGSKENLSMQMTFYTDRARKLRN